MQGEELLPYSPRETKESTRIKRNHLKKEKLHLKLLSDIFVKELSKVFNSHNSDNLSKQFDVCNSDESLDVESATDSKNFLKSLRTSTPDNLVFANLNINSIRKSLRCYRIRLKAI